MMRKTISILLAASLAGTVAACGDAETPADEATFAEDEWAAPASDDAVDVNLPDTELTTESDNVTISEDGVSANISDNNTRVKADVGDDPSISVSTD